MANKGLNSALDNHFEKVNSGSNYVHKKKRSIREIKGFFSKIKHYFKSEHRFLDVEDKGNYTIVKRVDTGFVKHCKAFFSSLKESFKKDEEATKLVKEN